MAAGAAVDAKENHGRGTTERQRIGLKGPVWEWKVSGFSAGTTVAGAPRNLSRVQRIGLGDERIGRGLLFVQLFECDSDFVNPENPPKSKANP